MRGTGLTCARGLACCPRVLCQPAAQVGEGLSSRHVQHADVQLFVTFENLSTNCSRRQLFPTSVSLITTVRDLQRARSQQNQWVFSEVIVQVGSPACSCPCNIISPLTLGDHRAHTEYLLVLSSLLIRCERGKRTPTLIFQPRTELWITTARLKN